MAIVVRLMALSGASDCPFTLWLRTARQTSQVADRFFSEQGLGCGEDGPPAILQLAWRTTRWREERSEEGVRKQSRPSNLSTTARLTDVIASVGEAAVFELFVFVISA